MRSRVKLAVMRSRLARISLAAAGCAGLETTAGARPSACDAELKAFAAVARIARTQGDNWAIYDPALQALKDQILDCVDESYPRAVGL